MRRVILAAALTITGLVLLLGYRTPAVTTSASPPAGVPWTGTCMTTATRAGSGHSIRSRSGRGVAT